VVNAQAAAPVEAEREQAEQDDEPADPRDPGLHRPQRAEHLDAQAAVRSAQGGDRPPRLAGDVDRPQPRRVGDARRVGRHVAAALDELVAHATCTNVPLPRAAARRAGRAAR
jgi:hypothetical protein